jgi:NAD(P)H-dependent flavin oxidoreductase YrpB (nitropropane dioxygenase family)
LAELSPQPRADDQHQHTAQTPPAPHGSPGGGAVTGEIDAGAWSRGMVACLIHDIPTCQQSIDSIVEGAEAIIRGRLERMLDA